MIGRVDNFRAKFQRGFHETIIITAQRQERLQFRLHHANAKARHERSALFTVGFLLGHLEFPIGQSDKFARPFLCPAVKRAKTAQRMVPRYWRAAYVRSPLFQVRRPRRSSFFMYATASTGRFAGFPPSGLLTRPRLARKVWAACKTAGTTGTALKMLTMVSRLAKMEKQMAND